MYRGVIFRQEPVGNTLVRPQEIATGGISSIDICAIGFDAPLRIFSRAA